nr:MAG TPA: hypothetical protein [Caudoviricetes sp.]DAV84184.1 MAG TPA: hypothetical protein [Caudoviricetes sp.]
MFLSYKFRIYSKVEFLYISTVPIIIVNCKYL